MAAATAEGCKTRRTHRSPLLALSAIGTSRHTSTYDPTANVTREQMAGFIARTWRLSR